MAGGRGGCVEKESVILFPVPKASEINILKRTSQTERTSQTDKVHLNGFFNSTIYRGKSRFLAERLVKLPFPKIHVYLPV